MNQSITIDPTYNLQLKGRPCLVVAGVSNAPISMQLEWALPVWPSLVFYLRAFDYFRGNLGFFPVRAFSSAAGIISTGITSLKLPLEIVFLLPVISLLWSAAFAFFHWVISKTVYVGFTLVLPAIATSIDYIFFLTHPFGSIAFCAYMQHTIFPLIQIAFLTGIWAVTSIDSWFAARVHFIWISGTRTAFGIPKKGAFLLFALLKILARSGLVDCTFSGNYFACACAFRFAFLLVVFQKILLT